MEEICMPEEIFSMYNSDYKNKSGKHFNIFNLKF